MHTTEINMPRRLNIHAASAVEIISMLGLRAAGVIIYRTRKKAVESTTMPRRTAYGKVRRKRGRAFRKRNSHLSNIAGSSLTLPLGDNYI